MLATLKLGLGLMLCLVGVYLGYLLVGMAQTFGSMDEKKAAIDLVGAAVAISAGLAMVLSGLKGLRSGR
jgi:hypothetical protein